MKPGCIPIRLSLAEVCAAALMEAADSIETARDVGAFVDALDGNHRLWLVLRDIESREDWVAPPVRDAEFATENSSGLGKGLSDATIDSVIAINRKIALDLTLGGDITRICSRVRLAYRESGGGGGFAAWTLIQIYKKSRLKSVFSSGSPPRSCHPAIRAAAVRAASEFQWPVAAD